MKPELARMLSNIPFFSALRRKAPSKPAQAGGDVPLEELEWEEFERLVLAGFLRRGYHSAGSVRVGAAAAAAGGDLLLRRDRETYLVYCKAWRSKKIGLSAVKALQAQMAARGAAGGFLVSFGRAGREATRFASAERIQLLDEAALKALIEPVRHAQRETNAASQPAESVPATARAVPESPNCPLCGKLMRLRTAKRGSHAGHGFWGCTDHPHCKGLRPLA
jgi:restriction system protein